MNVEQLYSDIVPLIMNIGPKNGSVVPVQVLISNRSYAVKSIEFNNNVLKFNIGNNALKFNEFSKEFLNIVQDIRKSKLLKNIKVVSGPLLKEITKVNYTNNVIQLVI